MVLIKYIVKSAVDNYILPGTFSGTEILLLYMLQWKRDLAAFTFASVYFFYSGFGFQTLEGVDTPLQKPAK